MNKASMARALVIVTAAGGLLAAPGPVAVAAEEKAAPMSCEQLLQFADFRRDSEIARLLESLRALAERHGAGDAVPDADAIPRTPLEVFLRDYCARHPNSSVIDGVMSFLLQPDPEPGVIGVAHRPDDFGRIPTIALDHAEASTLPARVRPNAGI